MKNKIESFLKEYNNLSFSTSNKKTNVIYLTTKCNMNCSYCYEKEVREKENFIHKDLTIEDINVFLKEIEIRENSYNSTIVIMGGEPFLKFNLIEYIIEYCKKSQKPFGWGISIVTNGTLLNHENISYLQKNLKDNQSNCVVSLEVSYDGIGHSRRIFSNGYPTKELVEKNLALLNTYNFPFSISYTVHIQNHLYVKQDIMRCIKKYSNLDKFILSFAQTEFEKIGINLQEYKKELLPFCELFYTKYNIPTCGAGCEFCDRCTKIEQNNSYLSPCKNIFEQPKYTLSNFKGF